MRPRHGAASSQRPPTMFESEANHDSTVTITHGMPARGRHLTDPDLLLHMQSPSGSTPSSTVRSTAPLRPRIDGSDFTMPLIPTIRADSPISTNSRDPRNADDLEPPRLWKTTSRGSRPNSPGVSACPSPTPSATPSSYSVRLKSSSGGGEPSAPRLQRKKSNASLLMKRGLSRMGSVMSRKGASTVVGREGSRHGPQSSTSTPPHRRLPRNNSFTLDDLVEEANVDTAPAITGPIRVQSPLQPLLPSQLYQSHARPGGGVSRPFNVQHQLHVTESLEGLPTEWLEQLKAQGLTEGDLSLIVAAHRKQRSVPLHPIAMLHSARQTKVHGVTLGDVSGPGPSHLPLVASDHAEDTHDDVHVTLRQREDRPSHGSPEAVGMRRPPREKPSLTIHVPPRERPKLQLEQSHMSPSAEAAHGAPCASSLTAAGSALTWPRAASTAAPSLPEMPVAAPAPPPVSPPKSGPEPRLPLEAAAARSPSATSLPPTPTSPSTSSRPRRRSRALSTQLRRSSSIITKLLTDLDPSVHRHSRPSSHHQYLRPRSRTENASGSDADDRRKFWRKDGNDHEPCPSFSNTGSWLNLGDEPASSARRLSDEIRGFQNLNIGLTDDGDEWAASILAAWDEEDTLEEPPEGIEVAPAPLQEDAVDQEGGECAPEEAEIRVARPLITKQASMISLRALMEDAEERKERPRPKSVFLDRVYSPPPPPRPMRVASPTYHSSPPSEPRLLVPMVSSSRLRCISVDSFGVQRPHSQTSTSPSSSEVDLSTPPLDENATDVIALPVPMTQPLRLASSAASSTPPLRILRSPGRNLPLNRSSSGKSLSAGTSRSRPSSRSSRRDVHLSPSAQSLNRARLSVQALASGSADSLSLCSPRSSRHYSPSYSSYSSSHRASLPRGPRPHSRPPPDAPRSNADTTEGTATTPAAHAFPSTGSFLPFDEEETRSPVGAFAADHRPESFSLPTSAASQSLEYVRQLRSQEHTRGQDSIQSIESLFAPSGALGLVLNLDGVNNRLSDVGAALSRASSCSSAHYSYQLHEVTVQRAYTQVLRRARKSVHDLGGDVDEVSSEGAYGEDTYEQCHSVPDQLVRGHRSTPSGPTGVDGVYTNARLVRVNELDDGDVDDGYHTAYASPRIDPNRMSVISMYSASVYHSASSAIEPDFAPAPPSKHLPPPPLPSQMVQLQAQLKAQRV